MDKEFFKDFTLHLDIDRAELASSRLEEEEGVYEQRKELFTSFSLKERDEDKGQESKEELIEGKFLDSSAMPLDVEGEALEPSKEAEHLLLDDVESPDEIEEKEVSNLDWEKVLDDLDKELETESYKTDILDQEKKDNSDTEIEDIAKWNLFNYEDDGNIEENYKVNTDFAWPSEEPKEESNTYVEDKSPHKDSVEDEVINDKGDLWEVKDQEELKEIFVYLDDLFANLPEHVIREFALSPYYIKYNDILDKLGI